MSSISSKVSSNFPSTSGRANEDMTIVLKDELETAMRLVGITDLSQVNSRFVNTKDLDYLVMDSIANGDGFVLKSKI